MDLKEIKSIVELMKRSGITEFELEEEGFKLRLCRSKGDTTTVVTAGSHPPFPIPTAVDHSAMSSHTLQPQSAPAISTANEPKNEPSNDDLFIKSPLVGTFYQSPSPESPPFVDNGSSVNKDTVVCIIEAMKVMNEIQAELDGVIEKVLVKNGEAIEFGQPLFKIKK